MSACLWEEGISPYANGWKVTVHKDKKIPFISNLKKPACASKQDVSETRDFMVHSAFLPMSHLYSCHSWYSKSSAGPEVVYKKSSFFVQLLGWQWKYCLSDTFAYFRTETFYASFTSKTTHSLQWSLWLINIKNRLRNNKPNLKKNKWKWI